MGLRNIFSLKGFLSIAADVVDFFLGAVPVIGTVVDAGVLLLALLLWGWYGLEAVLELVPLETVVPGLGTVVESFYPSCTVAAILAPDR